MAHNMHEVPFWHPFTVPTAAGRKGPLQPLHPFRSSVNQCLSLCMALSSPCSRWWGGVGSSHIPITNLSAPPWFFLPLSSVRRHLPSPSSLQLPSGQFLIPRPASHACRWDAGIPFTACGWEEDEKAENVLA